MAEYPSAVTVTQREFYAKDYPPPEWVLEPWLEVRGITMLAGWRGSGKSFVAVSTALAIAGQGEFLGFRAPTARNVLYIDGEMDPSKTRDRMKALENAMTLVPGVSDRLVVLTHFDQPLGIPDLSTEAGQYWVEDALAQTQSEVAIFDNVSCLFRSGAENEGGSWAGAQDWFVNLRREGITSLIIHHTGKPNMEGEYTQRGTSKREDILDASILLSPHKTYKNTFTLQFEKFRLDEKPDKIMAEIVWDKATNKCKFVNKSDAAVNADILRLSEEGLSSKEVGDRLRLSPQTVTRRLKKVQELSGR